MEILNFDVFSYSATIVIVFGILGNILVILSVLRQNKMLRNNYYFLILHLAFCDLAGLILYFIEYYWPGGRLPICNCHMLTCRGFVFDYFFKFAAVGMLLIISLLRYRAVVYPLKPSIGRRKLKVVCGLVYLVGLIAVCALYLPLCFVKSNVVYKAYEKFCNVFAIFFVFFVPVAFMTVVYFKIGQLLIKRSEYKKRVCLNSVTMRRPDSFFKILRYSISEVDEIFLFASALFFVTELEICLV